MTICFIGNDYKYEIEAVMKLFLPIISFDFRFEEEAPENGDVCIVRRGENLSVTVRLGSRTEMLESAACDDDEEELCRLLYRVMIKLTGTEPPWGCLTGIRPVKKVNRMIERGMSREEIFAGLRERYFVSEEKLELAYSTALNQQEILGSQCEGKFSLYVSVPFCPSRCGYCSFVSHSIETPGAKKLLPEYTEKLCTEIAGTAKWARELGLELDTVYIGGGTPTALTGPQLRDVMTAVKKSFDISKIREYTVEAGRADTISAEKLAVIRDFGATRISVNPQTMNDEVLRKIGRRHTAADFFSAYKLAREMGFRNINTDVIAGLPGDTLESFRNTIDTLIGLDPEGITVHTLTVKRSSRLFREEERDIPGSTAEMVRYGHKRLTEAGYRPYYLYRQKNTVENLENVGYAKPGYECLYNVCIMDDSQTILAAGAGGSTKLVDNATGRIERVYGCKYPYEYISRFDQIMSKKLRIKN